MRGGEGDRLGVKGKITGSGWVKRKVGVEGRGGGGGGEEEEGICVHAKVRARCITAEPLFQRFTERSGAEWLSEGADSRGPHWLLNYIWMERKGCCLATAYTTLRQNGEARSIRARASPRSLPFSPSLFSSAAAAAAVVVVVFVEDFQDVLLFSLSLSFSYSILLPFPSFASVGNEVSQHIFSPPPSPDWLSIRS